MVRSWLFKSRWSVFAPLLALLILLAAACGDDTTPAPAAAGATAAEVAAAVQAAVAGIQVPEGLSADTISSLVEDAVSGIDIPEGVSAAEIDRMVRDATEAAVAGADPGVTSEELAMAIDKAITKAVADTVMEAVTAAIPTPLPTFTPVPVATPASAMLTAPWVKQGKRGGIIPMQITTEQAFLDPHAEPGNAALTSKLMAQVLRYDHTDPNVIIGDLAKSWQASPDGNSYTFEFHEAVWPDGRAITAEDVKFSLDRMVEANSPRPRAGNLAPYYASSEVLDPETLKVNVTIPFSPAFLQYLAINYMKILPKHILEPMGTDENRQRFLNNPDNLNTVVSGPFMLKSALRGNLWEYERNSRYFKEGLPFLDGLRLFVIADVARLTAAFKTEQVLMSATADMGLSMRDLAAFQDDLQGKVKVHFLGPTAYDIFTMNWTKPPLDDARVRKAIYLAFDRLDFINTNHFGLAKFGTPFPPGSWMTPSDEEVATWPGFRYVDKDGNPVLNPLEVPDAVKDPRDLVEANRLLDDAGFDREGTTLTWLMGNAPLHRGMSTVAKEQLEKNIGVKLDLQLWDFPTIHQRNASGNYDFFYLWHGINVKDSDELFNQIYRDPGGSKNRQNWSTPRTQELFQQSAREGDPIKRQQMIWEVGDIIRSGESHSIGIDWRQNAVAVNSKVQNYHPPSTYQQGLHHESIWLAD